MVSNSKILTVSYGTFSCTLEGFDEPFNTMKSIAEYFRDLAADDRYFGAEPPTPDADMLHRIAEREIQKRVETRIENDEIVLRQRGAELPAVTKTGATHVEGEQLLAETAADQADAPQETATQEAKPEPVLFAAPEPGKKPTRVDLTPKAAEAGSGDEGVQQAAQEITQSEAAEKDADADNDSAAAKLRRLRAVVSAAQESGDYVEDQHAASFFGAAEQDVFEDDTALDVNVEDTSELVAEVEDAEVEAPAPAPQEELVSEDTAVAADAVEPDLADLEVAPEQADMQDAQDTVAEVEDATDVDPADIAADADGSDDVIGSVLGRMEDAPADAAQTDEDVRADAPTEAPQEDIPPADDASDIAEDNAIESDVDLEALDAVLMAETGAQDAAKDVVEPSEDLDVDALAQELAEDVVEDTADQPIDAPEDQGDALPVQAEAARPLARVVRVKRLRKSDGSEEIALTQPEETLAEDILDQPMPKVAEAEPDVDADAQMGLSAEEEAALLADLAEVEAELSDTSKDADAQAPAPSGDDAEVNAFLAALDEDTSETATRGANVFDDVANGQADDTLDRILAETNSQMESQEVTRRRNSIDHLKAAVQAKRADAEVGEDSTNEDRPEDAYRDDLAMAVRPRRPGRSAEKSGRRRMAPLVLVSEQRIDTDEDEAASKAASDTPVQPVRPRRVNRDDMVADAAQGPRAVAAQATSGEAPDFASYVTGADASDMTGLMEAAARYATDVEGRDQFGRPLLVRMLIGLEVNGGISREEALRAFAKLMKDGRIVKVAPGRFALAKDDRKEDDRQTA
ncbi:hypothetical protein [Aliiroseovarius marinus]|uniref:hypothetical protein n=1 Tax=Aliiroseovarius marinus TaxID=2500159 RepID=UPI003D7C3959